MLGGTTYLTMLKMHDEGDKGHKVERRFNVEMEMVDVWD